MVQHFAHEFEQVHFALIVRLALQESVKGVLPLAVVDGLHEVSYQGRHFTRVRYTTAGNYSLELEHFGTKRMGRGGGGVGLAPQLVVGAHDHGGGRAPGHPHDLQRGLLVRGRLHQSGVDLAEGHGDGAGRRVRRGRQRRHLRDLDLLLDVDVEGRRAWLVVVHVVAQGASQRLNGQLSLSHHLQLSRPVPLIHRTEFVSSASHSICSHGWKINND